MEMAAEISLAVAKWSRFRRLLPKPNYQFVPNSISPIALWVWKWVQVPFLKCLAGGLCPFRDLLVGETAAPELSGECGGGRTPPQISR
jgi:hypothetical protein